MLTIMRSFFVLLLSWLLFACSTTPAPVIDRMPVAKPNTTLKPSVSSKLKVTPSSKKIDSDWQPDTYTVKKGDTLFSIGLEHGYDYKEIAQSNAIKSPYNIQIGQTLKFSALKDKPISAENKPAQENSDGVVTYPINTEAGTVPTNATPTVIVINEPKAMREPYSDEALKKPLPTANPIASSTNTTQPSTAIKSEEKPEAKPDLKLNAQSADTLDWAWPTKGKVIANFNDAGNKGIDIEGSMGQSVQAAATGKVIYSGSDLRGYGKLVIVKHNANYLSVYANNNLILVKEGQQVSRGQKIAEMGDTDSNTVKLHFEIRHQGKSVDPAKFLASN